MKQLLIAAVLFWCIVDQYGQIYQCYTTINQCIYAKKLWMTCQEFNFPQQ